MEAIAEAPVVLLPNDELEKINATEAALAQILDRARSYATLPAITDPDVYDEIHRFTMMTVKVRTGALGLAKQLAEPHQQKADDIMAEGKRIGEQAREAERLTRPLKEAYEAEQDRLRQEKERAAAAKLQERTQAVINLGMKWNGTGYELGHYLIEAVDIKAAPDDKWDNLIAGVVDYRTEQQARIEQERAETERQRREEQQRLDEQRKEQEAERQRMNAERQEMERQRAELQRQQAEADAERKRIDDQNAAEFARQQREQEEAERIREQLKQESDNAAALKAKQKADKERTARLKSDKTRFAGLLHTLADLPYPKLEQPETVALRDEFGRRYHDMLAEFKQKLDNL